MSVFGKVIVFAFRRRVSQVFVSKLLLKKKRNHQAYRVKKETPQAATDTPPTNTHTKKLHHCTGSAALNKLPLKAHKFQQSNVQAAEGNGARLQRWAAPVRPQRCVVF